MFEIVSSPSSEIEKGSGAAANSVLFGPSFTAMFAFGRSVESTAGRGPCSAIIGSPKGKALETHPRRQLWRTLLVVFCSRSNVAVSNGALEDRTQKESVKLKESAQKCGFEKIKHTHLCVPTSLFARRRNIVAGQIFVPASA